MHEREPCLQLLVSPYHLAGNEARTRLPVDFSGQRLVPSAVRDEPRATAQLEERRWHVVGDGLLKFAPFVLIYPLWHAKSRVVTCGQCYVGT